VARFIKYEEQDHQQCLKAARLKYSQRLKPLSNQNHKFSLRPNPLPGQPENPPELLFNPHLVLSNSLYLLLRKLIPLPNLPLIVILRTPPSNRALPCSPESSKDKALFAPKPASTVPSKSSPIKTSKRKASLKHASTQDTPTEPQPKRAKKSTPSAISAKLTQLLQRRVVRGKIIKVKYFEEQGLGVFLHKLRAQGWFELFINTQLGCSVAELAEFYAN